MHVFKIIHFLTDMCIYTSLGSGSDIWTMAATSEMIQVSFCSAGDSLHSKCDPSGYTAIQSLLQAALKLIKMNQCFRTCSVF